MQGTSLNVHVASPTYCPGGKTVPDWVEKLETKTGGDEKLTKYIDVSAVLNDSKDEVRIAIVNRHATDSYNVPIRFGPACECSVEKVKVYEVWSADLKDNNGWDGERVKTVEKEVEWSGEYHLKEHSFQCRFSFLYLVSSAATEWSFF